MKIRITTALAGASFTYATGDVIELPDAEAAKYVAAGFATPVKSPKGKTEKTTPADEIELEVTTDPNA